MAGHSTGGSPRRERCFRYVALAVVTLGFGTLGEAAASATPAAVGGVTLRLAPDHGAGARPGSGPVTAQPGWASTNWSGYAVTSSSPYRAATATWNVPSVSGPNGSYSASWVGIDGFNNNSLIQTGTEQDFSGGSGHYSAWWTTSAQSFYEETITSGCTAATGLAGAPRVGPGNISAPPGGPGGAPGGPARGPGGPGGGGAGAPTATTGSATSVTSSGAILNGTVNPHALATTYYFQYGTTTGYGSTTASKSAGSGTSIVAVSASLSGLSAGITYDYRLVAVNSKGTSSGANATFTTPGSGGGGGASCGTVAAGDTMSASISETNTSTSTWSITLSDTTSGWSFTKSLTYKGPGASAEWIVEAPSLCSPRQCVVATLAGYGSEVFDPGTADNGNPGFVASEGGEMVNSSDTKVISMPSSPDSDTDGFTVAYGSAIPSPPSS
jgi:hypothetical protein